MDGFQVMALAVAALGGWLFVSAFLAPWGAAAGAKRSGIAARVRVAAGVILMVLGVIAYLAMRDISRSISL